jgi:AcrR family transcriptional regulator
VSILRLAEVSTTHADGRRLRSERSRQAVIDALLRLYDEGTIRPSAAEISAASGVSERSVFRHFADLEDLASAAIARQVGQVMGFYADPDPADDATGRIEALVDQRLALHARVGNLARAAAYHAVSSPTIARVVAERRALLRGQVERYLASDLELLPDGRRPGAVVALDQMLSLEALEHVRMQPERFSDAALRRLLIDNAGAILAAAHEEV